LWKVPIAAKSWWRWRKLGLKLVVVVEDSDGGKKLVEVAGTGG
jgi:hypothetical protein